MYHLSSFIKLKLLLPAVFVLLFQPGFSQESKTYPPSKFPDRIIMGLKGDPAHSRAVNWRTDESNKKAVAEIHEADPSPDFEKNARRVEAKSQSLVLDKREVQYHEVNFTELKPSTQYMYRVGDGKRWSEWFHFTTASDKPAPLTFLYFGDAQSDVRSLWSRAIRGAYSSFPKADFIIHAGDLINKANEDYQWGEWFEAGGWLNGMIPSLSTPGNHEYFRGKDKKAQLSMHWRPQFALPENGPEGLSETAYYVDYQGTRFITMDSEAAFSDSLVMKNQIDWFEKVAQNHGMRWTVVIHHHPIYSTKLSRDNKNWREKMEPLYKKHKIDMVLQGHDHSYARGMNMPLGQSRKKPDGPVYVVSVSGPKMYDIGLQNWMDRAASNTQLYQAVTIGDMTLSFKAYTVNGDLYDSFDLQKDEKGENTLLEYSSSLQMQERLGLPERLQKRFNQREMKEYNQRFLDYKARKNKL